MSCKFTVSAGRNVSPRAPSWVLLHPVCSDINHCIPEESGKETRAVFVSFLLLSRLLKKVVFVWHPPFPKKSVVPTLLFAFLPGFCVYRLGELCSYLYTQSLATNTGCSPVSQKDYWQYQKDWCELKLSATAYPRRNEHYCIFGSLINFGDIFPKWGIAAGCVRTVLMLDSNFKPTFLWYRIEVVDL